MCGIFCCYNHTGDLATFRPRAIALSKLQRHRGPDWSGCYVGDDSILVHERLAIVGVGECLLTVKDYMSVEMPVEGRDRGGKRRKCAF
jgi:asparagine synthetase B (glutamine-hydrolysing)